MTFAWLDKTLGVIEVIRKILTEIKDEKTTTTTPENSKMADKKGVHTASAFADIVEYEGGIYSALEHGMTADSLVDQDSELAKKWRELETIFNDSKNLVADIQILLDDTWGA